MLAVDQSASYALKAVLVAISAGNLVLLGSTIVPPVLAVVVCYALWRWAKRTDAREALERAERGE